MRRAAGTKASCPSSRPCATQKSVSKVTPNLGACTYHRVRSEQVMRLHSATSGGGIPAPRGHLTTRPRVQRAISCLALVALLLVAGATPSHAAWSPLCDVFPAAPTTNGVTVNYSTSVSCSNGAALVTAAGAGLDLRNSAGIWGVLTSVVNNYSSGTVSLSKSRTWNCNGTGNRLYKTKGFGRDVSENTRTKWSAERWLNC